VLGAFLGPRVEVVASVKEHDIGLGLLYIDTESHIVRQLVAGKGFTFATRVSTPSKASPTPCESSRCAEPDNIGHRAAILIPGA
jgi:hypothetical protein